MRVYRNFKSSRLESSGKNKVIGWEMTPTDVLAFFKSQGKTVVTFFGYSADYKSEKALLKIAEDVLGGYSPETCLINIGATSSGVGAIYPLAKSMGFTTTGIVSSLAIQQLDGISAAADHICFVTDDLWGGKLPDSDNLSPTSQAIVMCTDIFIGIGGGKISRDEMLAAKEQGKPVHFYPAEISHKVSLRSACKMNLPTPDSFWGEAHEVFADKHES